MQLTPFETIKKELEVALNIPLNPTSNVRAQGLQEAALRLELHKVEALHRLIELISSLTRSADGNPDTVASVLSVKV